MPFIVTDVQKAFYYRDLAEYEQAPGSCATHCGTFRICTRGTTDGTSRRAATLSVMSSIPG